MAIYALGDFKPELPAPGEYWLAPTATLIGRVRLAKGVSVWWGTVLRGDNEWISVGENTNIQDNCVLHTDPGLELTIGANVTVGHNVVVHGAQVGDNSLIGMGSVLLNRSRVGTNCIVAAHTLIAENKEFPDNSLIMGSPGRLVRTVSEQEAAMIALSAAHYAENWKPFARGLKKLD